MANIKEIIRSEEIRYVDQLKGDRFGNIGYCIIVCLAFLTVMYLIIFLWGGK